MPQQAKAQMPHESNSSPQVVGTASHPLSASGNLPAGESWHSQFSAGIYWRIMGTLLSREPAAESNFSELPVRSNRIGCREGASLLVPNPGASRLALRTCFSGRTLGLTAK